MENKEITPIILQQIENELRQKPNLSREEAIQIAVKITSEHTQITYNNSFLPPASYIHDLSDKNPEILKIVIEEWVKRNQSDRDIEIAEIRINEKINDNSHSLQKTKLYVSFLTILVCFGFLTYPIYLGRPDISAWAAAVLTAIAVILSKIKK